MGPPGALGAGGTTGLAVAGVAVAREAILAHCRARLSGYQVPRAVDFDPALPRTEAGKLARRGIRARYWQGRERRI